MKDLRAERSRFLLDQLQGWKKEMKDDAIGRAVKRVRSLPIEVRAEGLSTVVAILLADSKKEIAGLAELLAQWLLVKHPRSPLGEAGRDARASALLNLCVRAERQRYQAAQTEALELIAQLKILGDALYSKEANEVGDAD